MQIHILALLLFFQPFVACQQQQEINQSAAAGLAFQSVAVNQKALPAATNIIFQSADGGQTWQDVSEGLPEKLAVGRVFADDDEIFLASESGLFHKSTSLSNPEWDKEIFLSEKISDVFPGKYGMYATSYRRGFFKGIPGRDIWTSMHNTLEDKTVIAVLETPDGTIFAGCESGIYKSADNGQRWKHVFADKWINTLVASGDVLIAAGNEGMLRSTDGGEHWDRVLTGDGSAFRTKRIEGGLVTATGGGLWQEAKPNKLYTSADGGKTWQRIDEGLPLVREIYDIAQAGKYLFCSTDTGISRSADGGKTWELVRARDDEKKLIHLAVSGKMIFAVMVFGC